MNVLILVLFIALVVFTVWKFGKYEQPQQPAKKGGGRSKYAKKEQDR